MNKVIKVKDNKQKPKDACPAETDADSELQPKITTSCPACSNTFVGRSYFITARFTASANSLPCRVLDISAFNGFLSLPPALIKIL